MALHLRDQIVDAIAALLTGLTTTGSRVYVDRDADTEPLSAAELPGLTINQGDESSVVLSMPAPRVMQAFVDIDITAHAKKTTGTLTRRQINLIAQEVQVAMADNRDLSGKCKYTTLIQTDFSEQGDAEKPIATARLRYQAMYLFAENAPDVPQ